MQQLPLDIKALVATRAFILERPAFSNLIKVNIAGATYQIDQDQLELVLLNNLGYSTYVTNKILNYLYSFHYVVVTTIDGSISKLERNLYARSNSRNQT